MASILQNMKNWFRGKHEEIASAEGKAPWQANAVRDGGLAIKDAKAQEEEFSRKIVKVMAANKLLVTKQAEAQRQAEKYDAAAKAVAARIKAGDKTATRDELETVAAEVGKQRALAEELSKQLVANQESEKKLRGEREAMKNKIARADQNYVVLSARKEAADVRKNLASAAAQINSMTTGLGALDNLETAVQQSEAEADATEELGGKNAEDIAAKYAAASGSSLADDYLK